MSKHADTIRAYFRMAGPVQQLIGGTAFGPPDAALDALEAENQRLRDALRYITGRDVAGYEAHLRPEEVARAALIGATPK